ncbi:MAG: leucine-rich repeat domain-containing protein, partial [Clostridia bacterium]|nr:leucine-rich repeat domain-containing protein [Clostridia bacterium]
MRLKNFLIIILSLIIVLSAICAIPFTVFAATYSGNCGENVIWSFNTSSRILTISGSGEMCDYYGTDHAPWLRMYPEVESIIIEDGVTSIGNYAFYDLYMLKSVIIPDSVTCIGDWAFESCDRLNSVTIGNSVTRIGVKAFANCRCLSSAAITDSVTEICKYAFDNCDSITTVTIPDSVVSIGEWAFGGCNSLVDVSIGNSLADISPDAFCRSTAIENISVDKGNTVYHSDGNCIIETASKTLVTGCKNSTIPTDGSVISIGEKAFYQCTSLESITIPDSVTSIADRAFG